MEQIRTALGTIPIKFEDRGSPHVVLVIRGSFGAPDQLEWLQPETADVAFLHLPGFHSPGLAANSIGAFIAAIDEVIRTRLSGRAVTAMGISTGAVVAAGLRSPEVRARLLIEPYFTTEQLWVLHDFVQTFLADARPYDADWCWRVLGIARDRVENRDYSITLRGDKPIIALVGDDPLLPRRRWDRFPSLTSEEDRARLRAMGADVRLVSGGHDVPGNAPEAISAAIADLMSLP